MTTVYDAILDQIKSDFQKVRESANTYIPRLYNALKSEAGENFDRDDAADRIKKDCLPYWELDTIRKALPAEAKDEKKSAAAKQSHRNRKKKEEQKPAGENPASGEKKEEILVAAGGESVPQSSEAPAQPESTPAATNPVPQELQELPQLPSPESMEIKQLKAIIENRDNELKEVREELGKLSKAVSAVAGNAKNSPVYRELEDQLKKVVQENEELRAAVESSSQLTSAKEQEGNRTVVTLKNAKIGEAFIVLRAAMDKKRDVELVADAQKVVALLRGVPT